MSQYVIMCDAHCIHSYTAINLPDGVTCHNKLCYIFGNQSKKVPTWVEAVICCDRVCNRFKSISYF